MKKAFFGSRFHFNKITCLLQSNFELRPGLFGNTGSPLPKEGDIVNNPEAGIVNMIRSGLLALQLLPENSSAGKK